MWARLIVLLFVVCLSAVSVSAQSDFLPRGWDSFTTSYGYYGNGDVGGFTAMANLGFNGVADARVGAMYYVSGASNTGAFSTSVTWYPLKTNSPSSFTVGLTAGFQSARIAEYVTIGLGFTSVIQSVNGPVFLIRAGLARAKVLESFNEADLGQNEAIGQFGFGLVFGEGRSRIRVDVEATWLAGEPTYGLLISLVRSKKHDKRTYPKI